MPSLYMLDLDGLLIDTESLHFLAYRQMCTARGETLTWSFDQFAKCAHSAHGGLETSLRLELPRLFKRGEKWSDLYEEKQHLFDEILKSERVDCMPGAFDLLTWLSKQNVPFCAVTNSRRRHVEQLCALCPPLKMISRWWTREDYAEAKPSPSGYLAAIEAFKVPAHRALGFEDSAKGLKSLLAAGARAALISTQDLSFARQEPFLTAKWKRYHSLTEWMKIEGIAPIAPNFEI